MAAKLSSGIFPLGSSTRKARSTLFTSLFRLPPETRHLIWTKILHAKSGPNLLLVCREFYKDAYKIFYRSKTFRFLSPEEFRIFTATSGLIHDRNMLIRYLDLGIDCLYINDHTTPGRRLHATMPWQARKEVEVNQRLRAWGAICDDWDSFGFKSLRSVHFFFRQFAMYHLRGWLRRDFTDPTELWRLIHKLSRSTLVFGGAKDITQSGLFTIGAVRAFEHLVERRCALENFSHDYEAGPEQYPGTYGSRDLAYERAMDHIRQRNALTQLELLHLAAYCCKVKLQQHDTERLTILRERYKQANGGETLNYATQAHKLRISKIPYALVTKAIIDTMPSISLYRFWKIGAQSTPGWTWVDEICAPFQKWPFQPKRLDFAPINPKFQVTCSSSTIDRMLFSDIFASSTEFDLDLARLLDQTRWPARVNQAGASTLYCLCSRCETAALNGHAVPHTAPIT